MKKAVFVFLVLITPFWILGISARITFNNWFIDYEYSKKDFPEDRWKLPDEVRKKLAKIGLRAVLSEEGLKEFKNAKFTDGRKAFREKEINHMKDVNKFLSLFFPLTYSLFMLWTGGILLLKEYRSKLFLFSGFFSLLFLVFAGIVSFTDYSKAFEIFHNYFFGKTSWKFHYTDTLLRIYPMKFWFDGSIVIAILSAILSLMLTLVGIFFWRKNA